MSLSNKLTSSTSGMMFGTLLALAGTVSADSNGVKFGAAGWVQYGSIVHSSDTITGQDLNGRQIVSSGAQFVASYKASESFDLQAGLGAAAGHNIAAKPASVGGYAPVDVGPYIAEANFTYHAWDAEHSKLFLRGGFFPYDYATDNQNLGLYLLRGPAYPGYVLSGFETKNVLPVSNTFGFQLHHESGIFTQDFLYQFEIDIPTFWDMSPAYIASVQLGALRIGAGANFYHLISVDKRITDNKIWGRYIDPKNPTDTVVIPFQGTKLMANFSFDPKELMGGSESMGPEDLKLYGELGVNGLDTKGVYKEIYGPISQRIPMMIGFNIPAFKLLDRLSLEVEYYGAKFRDDLSTYNHTSGANATPFPVDTLTYNRDNVKWSLYASKIVSGHIKFSAQVANDHYRPGVFRGYGDNNPPTVDAVTMTPKDWYWMSKIAYFF